MKRLPLYGALLAAALVIPTERTDLGQLQPVETVLIDKEGEKTVIRTDTGDEGRGTTVNQALENLKETTPGVIYLDTADYLLVGPGAEGMISEIERNLKPSVRICRADADVDIEEATRYLSVHEPEQQLKNWKPGVTLQNLEKIDGRMILK